MLGIDDIQWADKAALVRADLNVQLDNGRIADDTRLKASLPTLQRLLAAGAGVVVMSHLGRPAEGEFDAAQSLAPVARALGALLGSDVPLVSLADARRPEAGRLVVLENTRFNVGEKANDSALAGRYAALGDVFVLDAFASAHRAEASTVALAHAAAQKCAGLLVAKEATALKSALAAPARPLLAIVGGAKVSTKLEVLARLADIADRVAVGGGIANTFLLALGHSIGRSLAEKSMVDQCERMLARHEARLLLPSDVVVASSIDSPAGETRPCDQVGSDELILDAGPATAQAICDAVASAGTVIWNGALGVFEREPFASGTSALAQAIGQTQAFTLAGGGETVAAANIYGVADQISCLSTGGGAFLEFVEGKQLPALAALE